MPRVFLSYSRKDQAVADVVTDFLSGNNVEVFIDYQQLQGGENYYARLSAEIKACDTFLLLISANSLASEWVGRELEYASRQKRRLVPVVLQAELDLGHWDFILGGLHRINFSRWYGDRQIAPPFNELLRSLGIMSPPAQPAASPTPQNPRPAIQPPPPARPPETEQARLLRELDTGATPHKRRQEIGDRLAQLGDPRPGVGIVTANVGGRSLELPDISWCAIPAPPGGKVWLGATDQGDNPRQEFKLDYSFKMAKYLITYRQYQTFSDSGEYAAPRWWAGFPKEYAPQPPLEQYHKGDSYPRERVSWYQSVAFTRWLTACYQAAGQLDPGQEIRLPSEGEWEYAARGTDERPYPWGAWQEGYANTREAGLGQTVAVGSYPQGASPFGVQDMSGQVWEWCLNNYSQPAQQNISSNMTDSKGLRGGSFVDDAYFAACAFRGDDDPHFDYNFLGLRVVVASPTRL